MQRQDSAQYGVIKGQMPIQMPFIAFPMVTIAYLNAKCGCIDYVGRAWYEKGVKSGYRTGEYELIQRQTLNAKNTLLTRMYTSMVLDSISGDII